MNKSNCTLLSFLVVIFFIGCQSQSQDDNTDSTAAPNTEKTDSGADIGRVNYAVVWKWATTDVALVRENTVQISEELTQLWEADRIENVYYDPVATVDKLANFPNVAFFLKAKDEKEARSVLDQLTVTTKGIASYKLHPVGQLWLDRKSVDTKKADLTQSFATVWTTLKSPLQVEKADELLKLQTETLIEHWNQGRVENVYFDIEGTYQANDKTDFVFFVNASSEAEARKICDSLPFFQAEIASYQLFQAGIFWMGQHQNDH